MALLLIVGGWLLQAGAVDEGDILSREGVDQHSSGGVSLRVERTREGRLAVAFDHPEYGRLKCSEAVGREEAFWVLWDEGHSQLWFVTEDVVRCSSFTPTSTQTDRYGFAEGMRKLQVPARLRSRIAEDAGIRP